MHKHAIVIFCGEDEEYRAAAVKRSDEEIMKYKPFFSARTATDIVPAMEF
jgi:hypothetical protein